MMKLSTVPLAFTFSLAILLGMAPSASAQNSSIHTSRYSPTAAGEWSFSVDHPYYSKTRFFAAGLTMDYGHNSLSVGSVTQDGTIVSSQTVIAHQLFMHLDIAGSFLDRVLVTASLPILLMERGEPLMNSSLAPAGAMLSDPRLGAMARVFGQPYASPVSLSVGAQLWIPVRKLSDGSPASDTDDGVRGLVKVALGGFTNRLLWSVTGGFLFRSPVVLETGIGSLGPELQLGAAVSYADMQRRFAVGPELMLSTSLDGNTFRSFSTSLEILLGGHYNIARQVQVSLAGGFGALHQIASPDGRLLLRIAYAPIRKEKPKDRDLDGIIDIQDQCPDEPQGLRPEPGKPGCPARDKDRDGLYDYEDKCPAEAEGAHPDPELPGCPLRDKDGDGILDPDDLCPEAPNTPIADPTRKGCPAGDKDGDGVLDHVDMCPSAVAKPVADPNKPGCPAGDKDGDGVYDPEDLCVSVHAGINPDPQKKGCPLPDRDHDLVPDMNDACPDQPGAPDPDPKKNGCPTQYVAVKEDQIFLIKEQVFFKKGKDEVSDRSFPLLSSVVTTLQGLPQIKKVRIEGHTDNVGSPERNTEVSEARAKSVMDWLIQHGIDAKRLESKGYGQTRPIADNADRKGRAKNRRVDFFIIDPPQLSVTHPIFGQPANFEPPPAAVTPPPPAAVTPPPSAVVVNPPSAAATPALDKKAARKAERAAKRAAEREAKKAAKAAERDGKDDAKADDAKKADGAKKDDDAKDDGAKKKRRHRRNKEEANP